MGSVTIVDCFHFLCPPRVKARLKEYLVHLKLYEARLRGLKAKINNLNNARDTVQHKIDEEDKRHGNGIPKEVADWIKAVDTVISEYDEFDKDEDHQLAVFELFKSGYLPKTGIRYRLSTKAFAITSKVNGLLQMAKHDTYSYWLGPPSIASFFHTVGYESFPSRDESMKKIKEALKSPDVRVIGLHGLSGVGKTTLVKKIARDALQASAADRMFDVVVMSSLTRNPDIRQIQGHIADALGMKLNEESDMARAARIQKRLKNESTLIILDDLWATMDLNMLGIPLDVDDADDQKILTETVKENSSGLLSKTRTMEETFGNLKEGKTPGENRKTETVKEILTGNVNEGKPTGEHSMTKSEGNSSVINTMKTEETLSHYKGCKVLLISESKQMLLNQMGGEENSIYFIKVLKEKEAEAFFKKMAGIGNGKTEFYKLMMSIVNKCNGLPMSIITTARALKGQSQSVWEDALCNIERGNFTGTSDFSTKLSYDLLEDEELKRAFLLCASMGPDTLIMDLMKYCVGLGFLQRVYTVKEARDRVYVLVGKLKECGLLSDSYSSDRFTMQDIVRNVALSIASKDSHTFTRTKEQIDEWPDKPEMFAVSLHHCHIIEGFPTTINYPRLKFFQVNNNDPDLKIPKDFFKEMKELRVLILAGISLSLLDSFASSLTKLRMLSLEQCMLLDKELSVIGELKKLRILSFSGSNIENLPVELNQLKKLQIFDISNCSKLKKIPPNVISSLISLEELYMRNTSIQWEVKEHNCQSKNASLSEFRHLYQLTTLDIHIPDADHFPKNLFFDKLSSYKIVVGDLNAYSNMDVKIPEKYEASRFLAIQLKNGDIHSEKGIKMLFERVENLFLEELNGVQDIFYRLNLKGFPYLKHLLIVNNSSIRSLIKPEDRKHTEKAFPKLESLHLYNLKSMTEICSCKLSTPSFRKLKVIKIHLCGKLTNVVLLSLVSLLTVLETIEVSECSTLKAVVVSECYTSTGNDSNARGVLNFPELPSANVVSECITSTEIVASETENNSNERKVLNFPELRSLALLSLPELIGFYPVSSNGAKVTELFDEKVKLPKLERMVLSSIQINKVWSDQSSQISCFKNLIYMDVNGCWNLEYLISFSMAKSLVNLQSLFVSECAKMSHIFNHGQVSQAEPKEDIFPNLKIIRLSCMKSLKEIWNSELPPNSFEKLNTLIIEKCDKFVNVFPFYMEGMFRSLCKLTVTNCKSMKAVFELVVKKQTDMVAPNTQYVYLETLPKLEHVWKWKKDPVGILDLKSLQKMLVLNCDCLEKIFPASEASKFPCLEYLEIRECFELKVIVPDFKKVDTNNHRKKPVPPALEFPNLTTIRFSALPKLLGFYPEEAYTLKCPTLNDLSIVLCDRLEPFKKATTVFSEEVINKLKCMKIESWHAKSATSYMGEGNHRQDNLEELCLSGLSNSGILYSFLHRNPNLKSLSLNNCFVTHIVPLKVPPEIENLGVVPNLERLTLINMPDLETIGFEEGIILERIELLILKNCPLLVNIIPSSVSLTHLTNLEVVNCGGLKILMPLSAAKSLVQLNSMKVTGCESMEEIVENENGGKVEEIVENENAVNVDIVFKKLRVLELLSLKKLNSFSKSCAIEFLSLEKLVVSECPKMASFSKKVQTSPLLERVFIVYEEEKKISCWNGDLNTTILKIFKEKKFFEGMDEISLSEHHDLLPVWNSFDDYVQRSWFNCLKILKLEDCEKIKCAIPCNIFLCLKSLKELKVQNCNKVEVIFENLENNNEAIRSQLKILTLEGLSELKHVWGENYKGNISFQNLIYVSVRNCEGLETLFPAAVAKNIEKLETLLIKFCQNLLGIVGKEVQVAADVAETFVFPCLTTLILDNLPQLTCFFDGIFTVECPELSNLFVLDCSKFELFQSEPLGGRGEGEGSSTSMNRQPLFLNLQAISFLEELFVDRIKLGSNLQLKEDLKLKLICLFFDVDDNVNPTLPSDILVKAPNLQHLTIGWCKSLEGFETSNLKISEQLKTLILRRVSELKFIWSENSSWLNIVCEKLHKLYVISCPGFTKLFRSPAVSLSNLLNLKELYIKECHRLQYLFTSSMAEVLMHLEKIHVKECESIKEIVEMEQYGTTSQELEFKNLHCISLDSLSSLEYFYSGNGTLKLPALALVDIQQCPKMEVFSKGQIEAEYFRGIHNSVQLFDESVFHKDLNGSVKVVFLLQMLSKGTDGTGFSKHSDLHDAWRDGLSIQNNWMYSLKTLKLVNCDIEPYAIPSKLFPCLKSLKILEVRSCNKVKQIFANNDTEGTPSQLSTLILEDLSELTLVWEKKFRGIRSFQNLKHVSVIGCISIQTLFPAVLAENLKMLETLDVQFCVKLEGIIGKEEDEATSSEKLFSFPQLTSLSFSNLLEFSYFYPEMFTADFPKLNRLSVVDCPKLELFNGAHPEGETESISTSICRQPLIPNFNAISILEELVLDWKHMSVLTLVLKEEDLKFLKFLFLFKNDNNEKATLPIEIIEKVPKLQELGLVNCFEIFLTQNTNGREHEILGQLKILVFHIITVSKLQYINLENSWLNIVIEKLYILRIIQCPDLKKLFRSPCAVSFSCMKELYISGCHGLKYLFTCSVAKVLTTLEKITVEESQSITEIVAKEQDETTSQEVKFERLCYIVLNSLTSLECFYPGNETLQLPALIQVDIWQCPNVEVFSQGKINAESFRGIQASSDSNDQLISYNNDLNASVKRVFLLQLLSEGMDVMKFSKYLELQEAWHGEHILQNNWFYNLTTLKLINCDIEPYAIPSNILPCLKSLKELEVRNCNKVKVIFSINVTDAIPSQLINLTLEDLSELTLVWEQNFQGILEFQYLQQVSVIGCKHIQTLFPTVLAENLNRLKKLEVKSCDALREIVGKEEVATGSEKKFWFPRLTSLDLNELQELTYFYPEMFTVECPNLDHFSVLDCPKLELFQGARPEGEAESVSASNNRQYFILNWCFCNLISLVMDGCEFLADAVLPSHVLPFLSNLKTLKVRNCNSIKAIFVNTKIGPQGSLGLPFLEKLCVENCNNLLEIVAKGEIATNEANEMITVFPRISILMLLNLHSLKCIYPGVHILEWPMLAALDVTHCPQLKFFTTEFQSSGDLHSECPTIPQAFVSLEKVTPNLEVLTLSKEEAKMIEQGKLHVDLQKLNILRLLCFHDKTNVFPFVFHSKAPLPCTNNLVVRHSAFKQIFPAQTPDVDYTKILSQLKTLALQSLPQLESIGFEHSWIGPFIENLQDIYVWDCACLTNLTPSTVSFSKLEKLDVKNCPRLKYLFTSSTAKTLSALKEMIIGNCESLIEIVAKEEDEPNEGEMLFKELSSLTLCLLPKLESFYSGSFTLSFSSLQELSFIQCNSTKVFRLGDKVRDELKVAIDRVICEGDKNEVIMQQIDEAT